MSERIGGQVVAPTLAMLGTSLVAVAVGHRLAFDTPATATGAAVLPGAMLVIGALWLARSDFSPRFHWTVLGWSLVGLAVLAGIVVAAAQVQTGGVRADKSGQLLIFLSGIGAVAGFVFGAQTVRRAEADRRAEAAETRATVLAEERTRLEVLGRTMRALVREETPEDVARTLVTEGHLGLPGRFVGVWLHDGERDRLTPVATQSNDTDLSVGPLRAETPAMEVFRRGETATLEPSPCLPDLPTLIASPLGDHGLLVVGASGNLHRRERNLVDVYVQSARAALDATAREARLREQRQFTNALLNSIEDIFFALDGEGRPIRWNDRATEVTGYSEAELAGLHALNFVDPEDHEAVAAAMERIYEEGTTETVEARLVTKGGQRIPYEFNGRRIHLPEEGVVGIAGTARDVTERKRRERELQRQNERLDAFASVLAHDLRNPLNVAHGRIDLAVETGDDEHLEAAEQSLQRINRLIDDVLELARGGTADLERAPVTLQRVVSDAWANVDTHEATLVVNDDLPTVEGDADRLVRLFENVFRNAVEHAGADARVEVGVPSDGIIYIADDGPGIPPEKRDEVFEHGVSTDRGGTGLGLAIVGTIAEAHGWTVAVTESADGGARFEFAVATL